MVLNFPGRLLSFETAIKFLTEAYRPIKNTNNKKKLNLKPRFMEIFEAYSKVLNENRTYPTSRTMNVQYCVCSSLIHFSQLLETTVNKFFEQAFLSVPCCCIEPVSPCTVHHNRPKTWVQDVNSPEVSKKLSMNLKPWELDYINVSAHRLWYLQGQLSVNKAKKAFTVCLEGLKLNSLQLGINAYGRFKENLITIKHSLKHDSSSLLKVSANISGTVRLKPMVMVSDCQLFWWF